MGTGIAFGVLVLIAGLFITVGLISDGPLLIGVGFLLMALCAIYGVQPNRTAAD